MFSKEQFTTVTPLSKGLALGVLIILPFVAFFLGMSYGQQSLPPVEIEVITTTDDVEKLLQEESDKLERETEVNGPETLSVEPPPCASEDKITVTVVPAILENIDNLDDAIEYFENMGLTIIEQPGPLGGVFIIKLPGLGDIRKLWIDRINEDGIGVADYHRIIGCDVVEF